MRLTGGNYSKREVVMVDPRSLTPSAHNPAARTTDRATAKLRREAEAAGAILAPVHITKDLGIKDGHRRTVVAIALGFKEIPAIVYSDEDCSQLFNQLNTSGRAFKPADQLNAYLNGGEPASEGIRAKGDYLRDLLSDLELERFVDAGHGPYLLHIAQQVAGYCYPGQDKGNATYKGFLRRVAVWLMDRQQQQAVRRYMEEFRGPAKRLVKFVERDEVVKFPVTRSRAA